MTGVSILGIGTTPLGKHPGASVKDLTRAALTGALSDAGVELADIRCAWFSNTRQGLMEGQNSIRGQCALRACGLTGIPIVNVENACASSTTGLLAAIASIRAGFCDLALVVGSEKMYYPEKDKAEIFRAFLGGTDIDDMENARSLFSRLGASVFPAGTSSDSGAHTFFMDMYAAIAKLHMERYGTTQRQLAAAAAKNHCHAVHNPLAQYRTAMSVDEVLADKVVTWPLTRSMCAPISDGASAVVLAPDASARVRDSRRSVRIRGIALASAGERAPEDLAHHVCRRAANEAYERAGVGPGDVDVAEVHDATSFAEILQIENLGFCEFGEGGPAVERNETALGGRIPVNTSGGLVSKGHPIAATGIIQLHELVVQLRGEAGARQVEGARIAVAENGGGFIGVEEAAAVVTVLEAPGR